MDINTCFIIYSTKKTKETKKEKECSRSNVLEENALVKEKINFGSIKKILVLVDN